MLGAIKLWLHWGVGNQSDYTLKRKTLHTNVGALIAILSMLNFYAVSLHIGSWVMIKIMFIQMPFLLLLSAVPWLNLKGWYNLARWSLAFSVIVSQLLAILIAFGSFLYVHYYFILFAIIPIAFFPRRQWWALIFLFALNVWLFLTFQNNWYAPDPEILNLDSSTIQSLRTGYTTTTFLTTLAFIWMMEVIAERNEKLLEKLSVTDVLTELPNRRYFDLSISQEMAASRRNGQPLALAMLDIDHFKRINDTFGHDEGDKVLKYIARQLRHSTRAGNVITRIGGEEFAIILSNTAIPEAIDVAERVRSAIESGDYRRQGDKVDITVSIGVCLVNQALSVEQACKAADNALYAAKESGRNRVMVCQQGELL
jgi:diguanylate cyclase (GGDEF)-like protein